MWDVDVHRRSLFRRSQRSRIRSKRPVASSTRVFAAPVKKAEQQPGLVDNNMQPQAEAVVAAEAEHQDVAPLAEMPDMPAAAAKPAAAAAVRPAAAAGSGSKQAARLQAAFEHPVEHASVDERRRPQEPRSAPRQRQWRDRGWVAGRHAQQPEAKPQVSTGTPCKPARPAARFGRVRVAHRCSELNSSGHG